MTRSTMILALVVLTSYLGFGQGELLTVAEKSDYKSTSTYADVMSFIAGLQKESQYIKVDTIAQSIDGRSVPLLIIANPLPENPAQVDDRIVVYIQANIHAGEIEGKEASLMLARELLKNPSSEIMKNVVVLIVPNLNPDGNDKISTKNRTNQNGPVNGVGERYNGQNLDLNRDAMKLETPEIKGVVKNILNYWDPAITVDCHTTNGSFHEEPLTYTWMSNPNGDRNLINYMRDDMMPSVRDTLLDKYKVENIFYGVFVDRMDYSKGWISYASEPRYLVNYIGLRNRLAILNENYVYADYKTRVNGCYSLLNAILEYAYENESDIKELLDQADERSIKRGNSPTIIDSFAIEYKVEPTPELITIKSFETDTIPGVKGYWRYKASDRKKTVTIPYLADYYPTISIKFPYAYLITVSDPELISVLNNHGIVIQRLGIDIKLQVEKFVIDEMKGSTKLNQGHYTENVVGNYIYAEKEFSKGTYVVFTKQKLGSLSSALLEPQSDDGLLKWNYFDRYLTPQWGSGYYPYPVYRLMKNTELNLIKE